MAEWVERRKLTERKSANRNMIMTQSISGILPSLDWLGKIAKQDKTLQYNNLLHHIDYELLSKAFYRLNRQASKGVDELSWYDYEKTLNYRLKNLHHRITSGVYKSKPVRRLWLEKANGEKRPIGVTAIEDKIVQQAVMFVLEPIYEADFLGFSYGFRPNRNAHNALDAVHIAISQRKVSWVLDADLKGFFDNINHQWMMTFLEHRIADKRVLRLIKGWLKAGVVDGKVKYKTMTGTPQGAVISPLLANIYLHYVLDLWVNQWRKRHARGDVYIVRYADDFVIGFQYKSDGATLKQQLNTRLAKFSLSVNEDKTHLIEFGRFAISSRRKRKQSKPETFNFLGFTHICSIKMLNGDFKLHRVSIKKNLRRKLKEIEERLMQTRHKSPYEVGRWVRSVLTGYFNYFAVPGNSASIGIMRTEVCKAWLKAIRRRSQKGRGFNWKRMALLVRIFIPHTRVRHPYPNQRLCV